MNNYFDEVAKVWKHWGAEKIELLPYTKNVKYLENWKRKALKSIGGLATLLSKDLNILIMATPLKMRDESLKRINVVKIENISINDENSWIIEWKIRCNLQFNCFSSYCR